MPLRNACFVSYRHGQFDLMKQFAADLYDALSSELEPMMGHNCVFMDRNRLQGGAFYNRELAVSLYESATMLQIFTPTYFHREHTYCAREFLAMQRLEAERLRLLECAGGQPRKGLIIPVILRGQSFLPEAIRSERQWHSFENFLLGGRRLSHHPRFAPAIREIAGYICGRFHELIRLPEDTFRPEEFVLPTDHEVGSFLDSLEPYRMAFPGR